MRYVTLRIDSEAESLHAIDRAELPRTVGRGPVHRLELLADDSVVFLRSVGADLAAYEAVLADHDAVRSYSVVGAETGHAFVNATATPTTRALMRWGRGHPFVLGMPIPFDGDAPVVTLVGAVAAFADATASLPDPLTYEVVDTGKYWPNDPVPFHGLTDRQREILATAIDLGYYRNPREATQAEVGTAVSLAPGTVGDHLRTIEAHVFSGRFRLGRGSP